jgi:hypothetical protein
LKPTERRAGEDKAAWTPPEARVAGVE